MENNNQIGHTEQKKLTYVVHDNDKIDKKTKKLNAEADSKTLQVVVILGTTCALMLGVAYYLHSTKPLKFYSSKCSQKVHATDTHVDYL